MESTTFKVFGIVTIFILTLFLCDPARGAGVEPLDTEPVNTWDAVHELLHNDYGVANAERNALVAELDAVLALVRYAEGRIDNFDTENGLDNLDVRVNALLGLIEETGRALSSVTRDITWFVKNHKGI